MDTTFRGKTTSGGSSESVPSGSEPTRGTEAKAEVPFLDYRQEHGQPFTVDYFKLGEFWNGEDGSFESEVNAIENYFRKRIESGEIANDKGAIEKEIKKIEKMNNLKDEPRSLVKIETVAAYIAFLEETDKIKFNLKKYGK